MATTTPAPPCTPSESASAAAWPAILLLTVAVGGMYSNLAMCVGLRRDWGTLRHKGFYPYLLSLAVGDLVNCLLVMPMAVIHAILGNSQSHSRTDYHQLINSITNYLQFINSITNYL